MMKMSQRNPIHASISYIVTKDVPYIIQACFAFGSHQGKDEANPKRFPKES